MTHRQNFDDIRVLQIHAKLGFAGEQIDTELIFAPTPPQNLGRHDAAGTRILRAKDATEATGSNFVKELIAAEDKTLGIPFKDFRALPGRY